MSKFCPEWIFSTFAAQTSKEFLSSNKYVFEYKQLKLRVLFISYEFIIG